MAQKKQKNSNATLVLFAIILIILTVAFSCIGYYAWAKYTKSKPGDAVAEVAKWHFELTPGSVEGTPRSNFAYTRTDGYGDVATDKLAPGTFGIIPIEIDTTKTEVTMTYDIKVQIQNCPKNIVFYTDEAKTNALTKKEIDENTIELAISKYLPLGELNKKHDETIYWNWPYQTYESDGAGGQSSTKGDTQDTKDQGKDVSITITATGTEVLEEPKLKVGDLTKENAAEHYGKIVDYSAAPNGETIVWRLFYIDFEDPDGNGVGKYGEEVGTIYLKADYNSSRTRTLRDYSDSYSNSIDTKIEEMNPLWAAQMASVDWNENEKAAAYLCDTTEWEAYEGDSKYTSYVNYAIGSPSVEMYIDSYNAYYENHEGGNRNVLDYYYKEASNPGYGYKVNGTIKNGGLYTDPLTLNQNSMYTNSIGSGTWVLASPSPESNENICGVYANGFFLRSVWKGNSTGVCPVVSLEPGSPIEFK